MYMLNNIIKRLNWRQCLIYLTSIYEKVIGVYVYGCADNAKGERTYISDYNDIDTYELCGIIKNNERLNK